MTTETIKQITEISTELKNMHGDDYGEQFCNRALYLITNNTVNKTDYQIIFEAVYTLIDSDYKDRLIFNLQKKIKEQDARITKLEQENKTLKDEIKELKIENQNLNKKVDILMRNHNIVILAESIKTIQYYIIQRATGFDDARMKDITLNLDDFINNPLYAQYKLEIEKLQEHFEISKYQLVINKIINKRNRLSHPNPIEMDELKLACEDMKTVYSGIDAIYNHYQEVYNYFNC
jgi:hypothetical protein